MIPGEDRRGKPKAFDPEAFRQQVHCPDGCLPGSDECDEHGYCEHLVGYTEDLRKYRPIVRRTLVDAAGNQKVDEAGQPIPSDYRYVSNTELPLEPGDVCVLVSQSYRVYRPTGVVRTRDYGDVIPERPERVIIKGPKARGREREGTNVS